MQTFFFIFFLFLISEDYSNSISFACEFELTSLTSSFVVCFVADAIHRDKHITHTILFMIWHSL